MPNWRSHRKNWTLLPFGWELGRAWVAVSWQTFKRQMFASSISLAHSHVLAWGQLTSGYKLTFHTTFTRMLDHYNWHIFGWLWRHCARFPSLLLLSPELFRIFCSKEMTQENGTRPTVDGNTMSQVQLLNGLWQQYFAFTYCRSVTNSNWFHSIIQQSEFVAMKTSKMKTKS